MTKWLITKLSTPCQAENALSRRSHALFDIALSNNCGDAAVVWRWCGGVVVVVGGGVGVQRTRKGGQLLLSPLLVLGVLTTNAT